MREFRFLNYYTDYSCSGDLVRSREIRACFSDVFHLKKGKSYYKIDYEIYIWKGIFNLEKNRDNNCLLTKEQLIKHVAILKNLMQFQFSIEEKIDRSFHEYYLLHLHLEAPLIYHKFALTWIRYSYEFPGNLYLLHVAKIKQLKGFKFVNSIMLFHLLMMTYRKGRDIHCLMSPYNVFKLLKYKDLKHRMDLTISSVGESCEVSKVFDIYGNKGFCDDDYDDEFDDDDEEHEEPELSPEELEKKENIDDIQCLDTDTLEASEDWESDDYFKTVLPTYLHNYSILKKISK